MKIHIIHLILASGFVTGMMAATGVAVLLA